MDANEGHVAELADHDLGHEYLTAGDQMPAHRAAVRIGERRVRMEEGTADDPLAFGQPVLRAKLHTHASGDFEFDYAFPEGGIYFLRALPYSLGSTVTPQFFGGEAGGAHLVFPVSVAQDPNPEGVNQTVQGDDKQDAESPGPSLLVLVAALAAVVVVRRNERKG